MGGEDRAGRWEGKIGREDGRGRSGGKMGGEDRVRSENGWGGIRWQL